VDAVARVTGQATSTNDLKLPGMLSARVLRSPHPHARIRRIDARAALCLPGVRAVITHENAPVVWGAGAVAGGRQYSDAIKAITRQRRSILNNPVRCVGDAVAAVAATDRHIAERALALIRVDDERLPFVLEPEAALAADAPRLWPEGNLCLDVHNDAAPVVADHGDLAAGLAAADRVFAQRYDTGFVQNAQLEPRCALAHRAAVQGGCHQRGHGDRHPARRLQWHGPLPQERRGHRWPGAVCLPPSVSFALAGVHQPHHLGQFPRAVGTPRGLWHRIDHG
jgi:xanthine dehydrogenase molybdenum-binding subunit